MNRPQSGKPHFWHRTEGISALELALIMPILLLCVCGIIDFGNLYVHSNLVSDAASTGALVAVNGPTPQTTLQTTVRSDYLGSDGNPNNNLTVTTDYGDTPPAAGTPTAITVTVKTPVSVITPLISAYFQSNPVTVTGSSTRATEY